MARMRTFIAVEPAKTVRERMVALQEKIAESAADVKWVEPPNLHVTLFFLGEVEDRNLPNVCRLVADAADKHRTFLMSVESVGCFPSPRRPRIVWAGIGEGSVSLCALHATLEAPLTALGVRREERRFTPHITLGRVRFEANPQRLLAALRQHTVWKGGETAVSDVLVMGSELTSNGPRYTIIGRGRLDREVEKPNA